MDFVNALKNELNTNVTENGLVGYKSTNNILLDFNYKVPSMRKMDNTTLNKEIDRLLDGVEDKEILFRYIFYLRDVRGGMGERRVFRAIIKRMAERRMKEVVSLIPLIAEYGRYDDLFVLKDTPYEEDMTYFVFMTLNSDIQRWYENKPITLLAKWMPSENASSKETKKLAKYFREKFELPPKVYRQLLSDLRGYLSVVEHRISKEEYSKINYESVPSKANLRYGKLFLQKDYKRRQEFLKSLEKGEAEVKSQTLYPSDVVSYVRNNCVHRYSGKRNMCTEEETLAKGMWKGLKDFGKIGNTLVVVDVSGSMESNVGGKVEALDVSLGLGMYFAERNTAPFKDMVVSFSERPEMCQLKSGDIVNNICRMLDMDWGMNTNIKRVFDLVLDTAKKNNCSQEDIPEILIISDMEFDSCGGGKYLHDFDSISEKFEKAGYKLPRLTFWNVNSRSNTIPMRENNNGLVLVSGFSPSSIKAVMSGELDPYKALLACITVPRYDRVVDAIKRI